MNSTLAADSANHPSRMPAREPLGAALRLDELATQQSATVLGMRQPDTEQDRHLILRLTEIGFIPGERVRIVATGAPGREPLAVRLGRSTFALRRHEASFIRVAVGSLHD